MTPLPPFRALLCAFLLILVSLAPARAQEAQEDPEQQVEDRITVTAQRVEQSLQDVPLSVVAIEGEELESRALTDAQTLGEAVPGVVVSSQSSSNGEVALTIRGIGSNTFGLGTESTVGYYVDGIYIPRPQGFLNQFVDVERIEVLRGPQGTLWGRNSTGGTINVITRRPSNAFEARLFGEYSEFDSPDSATGQRLQGGVSGALSETVRARLSGSWSDIEDTTFNEFSGRSVDNIDGNSLRGSLDFLIGDSLSILVRADHTDDASHNNFNLKPASITPISTLGTLFRFYGISDIPDVHRIAANIEPVSEYSESGISVGLNAVLDSSGTELESISSFREFDSTRSADIDGSPLDFVENQGDFDVEWWSQELKITGGNDRFDWIAGVYAFHEEGTTLVDTRTDLALFQVHFFASNPGLFLFDPGTFCSLGFIAPSFLCGIDYYQAIAPALGLALPGNVSSGNFFRTALDTDSYSGYGQLYWHLNDQWTLTGGLRYTNDDKDHTQNTIDFLTQQPFVQSDSDSWDALTPKVGVEYRPDADTMVYGSIATGFKSGGFNSISIQPSFDEETITSYEVGVKSTFHDNRVTFNAAAFHYDYDDLQVAVLFPDRSQIENAAEATVNGLEVDLRVRPSSGFEFELGLSFLDDEFDRFSSQNPVEIARVQDELNQQGVFDPVQLAIAGAAVPLTDLSGRGLLKAPDVSATAAVQYTWDFDDAGGLTGRLGYSYSDDVAFDAFGEFTQESYDLLSANLRYASSDGRWFVNLFGRNLGDEEYQVAELFARVTGSLKVWAPPRQVGVQVGLNF